MKFHAHGGSGLPSVAERIQSGRRVDHLYDSVAKASKQLQRVSESEWGYEKGQVIRPPANFYALVALLQQSTWHARCCELKARITAGDGVSIRPRDPGADRSALNDAERKELAEMARRVNPDESLNTVSYRVEYDLESLGNAYIEVIRDSLGNPVELYHVPAVNVRVGRDEQGQPFGFWQMDQVRRNRLIFFKDFGDETPRNYRTGEAMGRSTGADFLASEIIHIKSYAPASHFYGLPEWLASMLAMQGSRAAERWNADFFAHNTIPRKIITFLGGEPSDDLISEIEDYFVNQKDGRNHKPLILYGMPTAAGFDGDSAKVQVESLETTDTDGGFERYQAANRDQIVAAHGVPPSLLGIQSNTGRAGTGEMSRRDFKSLVIQPRQGVLHEVYNELLLADRRRGWGIIDWVIVLGCFDLSDSAFKLQEAEQLRKQVSSGMMTIDEARIAQGLPPFDLPGTQEPFVMQPSGALYFRGVDPADRDTWGRPNGDQAEQSEQSDQLGPVTDEDNE